MYLYVGIYAHLCISQLLLVINSMIMMPALMTLKCCSTCPLFILLLLLYPHTIAALSHSDRKNHFWSLRIIDTLIDVKVSEQVNQA